MWFLDFLRVSDSTAQSVLCQPIVQADGTIVGKRLFRFSFLRLSIDDK